MTRRQVCVLAVAMALCFYCAPIALRAEDVPRLLGVGQALAYIVAAVGCVWLADWGQL